MNIPQRRLLSRSEAADYCGLSLPVFERVCPVRPYDLGGPRLHRWDVRALDRWIDGLQGGARAPENEDDDEWLARAGNERRKA